MRRSNRHTHQHTIDLTPGPPALSMEVWDQGDDETMRRELTRVQLTTAGLIFLGMAAWLIFEVVR